MLQGYFDTMQSLPTLIKLSQQRVDRQRMRLVKFQDIHQDLSDQISVMRQNLKDETEKARKDPMLSALYGEYAHNMKVRITGIQTKIDENLVRIKQEQDRLATLFKDQKVLEVYKEKQEEKQQALRDKREQDQLDEIAARLRMTQC